MPQMSPINWLSLFIMFSIAFMLFNMMNYYSFNSIMPKSMTNNMKSTNKFNWKW